MIRLYLAGLLVCIAGDAFAHQRSYSYSYWDLERNPVRVELRVSQLELTRLPMGAAWGSELSDALATYLLRSLTLHTANARCIPVARPRLLQGRQGQARFEFYLDCGGGQPSAIVSSLFREVMPTHIHFARIIGPQWKEHVLDFDRAEWAFRSQTKASSISIGEATVLGMKHIATGYDHLVFIWVLILMAGTARGLIVVLTGFTLGHSVTLGFATLGWLHPEVRAVEALIGFSIALVATENAWLEAGRSRFVSVIAGSMLFVVVGLSLVGWGLDFPIAAGIALFAFCYWRLLGIQRVPERLRLLVAVAFGLVHGFGFAGVLAEMNLASDSGLPVLFGFNLGVEVGQLLIVTVIWPLLHLVMIHRPIVYRGITDAATLVSCSLGVFWFVTRAFV